MGGSSLLRALIKKGIVTDLARVVHHLDLSNPAMTSTINSTFKPLELLLRYLNQPSPTTNKTQPAPTSQPLDNASAAQQGAEEEVGMRDVVDEMVSAASDADHPLASVLLQGAVLGVLRGDFWFCCFGVLFLLGVLLWWWLCYCCII